MSEIEPVTYCNIDGQKLDPALIAKALPKIKRTITKKTGRFGWAVKGIPPGALESAKADHAYLLQFPNSDKEPWNEQAWLNKAKRVNAHKPFSIPEAAQQYKELAEKAGWLRVQVIELKYK